MNATELKLARKNRENDPSSWDELYSAEIVRRIRCRYTVNQELAVLRQRDTKPDEFAAYNEYVEQCKAEVKAEMNAEEPNAINEAQTTNRAENLFFFD